MQKNIISFTNVSKTFASEINPVYALKDITFNVKQGEVFGLVGESGSGKTTVLHLCMGLLRADSGTLSVSNIDMTQASKKELQQLRQKTGVVFQGDSLLNNLTVLDNVILPLKLNNHNSKKQSKSSLTKLAGEMLEFVGLTDKITSYPSQLSGGQRQRIAIARALISKPQTLLFDEPTSALDASARSDVLRLILQSQKEFKTTCVIVSHDMHAIKNVCERAALINGGKLEEIIDVKKQQISKPQSYIDEAKEFLEK